MFNKILYPFKYGTACSAETSKKPLSVSSLWYALWVTSSVTESSRSFLSFTRMERRLSRDPKYSTCFCKAATCARKSAISRCWSSTDGGVALGVAVWLLRWRGKQVKQRLRIVARMGFNCQSFFITQEVYQCVPLSTTVCTVR